WPRWFRRRQLGWRRLRRRWWRLWRFWWRLIRRRRGKRKLVRLERLMTHENLTNEFVEKLRAAACENLVSVILYGSAAHGEFHPEYSDLNLLCLMRDVSFPALNQIAGAVSWWRGKRHHPPLVITSEELKTSADVFSIEFTDMKQRYRVLYGEDLLRDLHVPMTHHRQQLEYEIREKLFLLRQHLLLAG